MDKGDYMAIGTIFKFLLGFIGVITTLVLLVTGLMKKDNKKLKRAGLVFAGNWVILILMTAIEFFLLANL